MSLPTQVPQTIVTHNPGGFCAHTTEFRGRTDGHGNVVFASPGDGIKAIVKRLRWVYAHTTNMSIEEVLSAYFDGNVTLSLRASSKVCDFLHLEHGQACLVNARLDRSWQMYTMVLAIIETVNGRPDPTWPTWPLWYRLTDIWNAMRAASPDERP